MGLEQKPKEVLEVIRRSATDDPQAQKHQMAMSRKGGQVSALNRIRRQAEKEIEAKQVKKDLLQSHIESNEHILTLDGEDGEFPDGNIPSDLKG